MDHTSYFHGDLVSSNRILYTPSIFARTCLLHLQEIGCLQAQQPHMSRRTNLPSYLFFLVLSGSGTLEYNGILYNLYAGDCAFLDCKKPYAHKTSKELWRLKWAHFYGPNMNNIYHKYKERGGHTCFHPINFQNYVLLLDSLYEIASSPDYVRDMLIFEKIASLLTLLMEESWHPERRKHAPKRQNLQHVKEYLDIHYKEKISLDFLAEKFYMNKFYLTRIFKEQFGVSVNSYLLQTKITHAKHMLRFTDKTVENIGLECGIGDGNYFIKVFKKVEGITPGQFRKSWVNPL